MYGFAHELGDVVTTLDSLTVSEMMHGFPFLYTVTDRRLHECPGGTQRCYALEGRHGNILLNEICIVRSDDPRVVALLNAANERKGD